MQILDARYLTSNTDYTKCPNPNLPEYAFIGRSNVGKSTLINMLTCRRKLARTSGIPGKTRTINHYIINDGWYIADLPGIGYARVPKKEKKGWDAMITDYLLFRRNLLNTFLLIDIRLEPQNIDLEFIEWLGTCQLPFSIIFTKADKLSSSRQHQHIESYRKLLLKRWEYLPEIFITSSKTGTGKNEILDVIQKTNQIYKV